MKHSTVQSLGSLDILKKQLQSYIYDHIQEQYKPKNEAIYYDVTNYYFEIDDNDDFRKKGLIKNIDLILLFKWGCLWTL